MTVPKGAYDSTKRRYGTVIRGVWYCHVEKFDNSLFPIVHVLNIDNQKENIILCSPKFAEIRHKDFQFYRGAYFYPTAVGTFEIKCSILLAA